MNDYVNYKWKNFIDKIEEPLKRAKILITEKGPEPDMAKMPVSLETPPVESEKYISLPQFRITENWGKPGHDDREIIEKFMKKIRGKSFAERIGKVNTFINGCNASCIKKTSTSKILANLIFLDTLASISYDFNNAVGGFLFEAFLAALYGGSAHQVEVGKGGIEDIEDDNGHKISLKFFDSGQIYDRDKGKWKPTGSKYVGGSVYDLINTVNNQQAPITYLLVLKKRDGDSVSEVQFYEFTVGTRARMVRSPKNKEPVHSGKGIRGDFSVGGPGKTGPYISGTSANKFKILISEIKEKRAPIATLEFGSKDFLRTIAEKYVDQLQNEVKIVFNRLDSLTRNLNRYFAGGRGKTEAIEKAYTDAQELEGGVATVKQKWKPDPTD
jgi:hypothetical protein